MTIPPLPLVNGALILDNSYIECIQTCPRSFLFKYELKRIAITPGPGRNFGSAIHEALAIRYTYSGAQEANEDREQEMNVTLRSYFEKNPQPEDDFRNVDHAINVVRAYNNSYKAEPFTIQAVGDTPIVERSFLLPIGNVSSPVYGLVPIYYAGKIDLMVRDSIGLWVVDHKTAHQFGKSFEAEMASDSGQLGYCWAGGQIFGEKPNGYITNAIRIRKPKRGDVYEDKAPVDGTDFRRLITTVNQDRLDEFVLTVLDWARSLIRFHEDNRFPRVSGKKGCVAKYGICEYYDVCGAPEESRERLLASPMFMANQWSPLKKGSE